MRTATSRRIGVAPYPSQHTLIHTDHSREAPCLSRMRASGNGSLSCGGRRLRRGPCAGPADPGEKARPKGRREGRPRSPRAALRPAISQPGTRCGSRRSPKSRPSPPARGSPGHPPPRSRWPGPGDSAPARAAAPLPRSGGFPPGARRSERRSSRSAVRSPPPQPIEAVRSAPVSRRSPRPRSGGPLVSGLGCRGRYRLRRRDRGRPFTVAVPAAPPAIPRHRARSGAGGVRRPNRRALRSSPGGRRCGRNRLKGAPP